MTLPYERTRAVNSTYEFLCDLLDPKKTPRLSKKIRTRAAACLRHYPSEYDMEVISSREDSVVIHIPLAHKVFGNTL